MIKMSNVEAKNELFKMLDYFNDFCRKNDIKYSLIGGSLIGAIRHKGMIPWDDDIDIILTKENYLKLKEIFNKKSKNDDYILFDYDFNKDFYFPFMKLINIKTYVDEHNSHKKIEEYGLFLDIFCYTDAPNDQKSRYNLYKKIRKYNSLLSITSPFENGIDLKTRVLRISKNIISSILGKNKIHKLEKKAIFNNKYDGSDWVVSNWPVYSFEKEIQRKEDTLQYIDADFENIRVMIFKNYDNILKTTFGNYMELPPIEKRVNHNMDVYWRNKK